LVFVYLLQLLSPFSEGKSALDNAQRRVRRHGDPALKAKLAFVHSSFDLVSELIRLDADIEEKNKEIDQFITSKERKVQLDTEIDDLATQRSSLVTRAVHSVYKAKSSMEGKQSSTFMKEVVDPLVHSLRLMFAVLKAVTGHSGSRGRSRGGRGSGHRRAHGRCDSPSEVCWFMC
jgi:hypothetical protein